MPSKARLRKKANAIIAESVTEMLGRMTLDEQTIRSTLRSAKNGSLIHISMISQFMPKLPAAYVPDAVSILCTVLDVPAFPPEQPLPSSLSSSRKPALQALLGLALVPGSALSDKQSPLYGVLEENWPMLCNWIQHFHNELITQRPEASKFGQDSLLTVIASGMPAIIAIFSSNPAVFERLTIKDDGLLSLLVKFWLTPDVVIPYAAFTVRRLQCYSLLQDSLTILNKHDPSGQRLTSMIQNILCEAQGDAGVVAKKLLQQLRNPAKACRESFELVEHACKVLYFLLHERLEFDIRSKFLDSLLKDNIVPLMAQLLSFVSEDLANPPKRQVIPDDISSTMIQCGLHILFNCIRFQNGQHWAAVLFKLGFLRTIARILSSDEHSRTFHSEILTGIFSIAIPGCLCHRFVVTSAIKAVKDITINGEVAILEASAVKESWETFTNILLERTVINTVYERDFIKLDVVKCENCEKEKQETLLFKCAGCKTAMYCSRECQTTSWKTGGHRSECKEKQELWDLTGMVVTTGVLTFLKFIAVAELRRHMPGVVKHLASVDNNASGISLGNAHLTVFLFCLSPIIIVRPGDSPPIVPDSKDARDRVHNGLPASFEVASAWGGKEPFVTEFDFPPNIQLFAPGKEYAGDVEVEDAHLMRRNPAMDESGKNLAFVLDEVDRHVMDARKHFRLPAPGDEESPKTIYDYVEAKVTADPDVLAWMGLN